MILFPTSFLVKFSILLLYRRIFTTKGLWFYSLYIGIILTGLIYLPNIIVGAVFCAPRAGQSWEVKNIPCAETELWFLIQAALVVLLDIYIFVLPIPTISGLQMSRRRKIEIMMVFASAVL